MIYLYESSIGQMAKIFTNEIYPKCAAELQSLQMKDLQSKQLSVQLANRGCLQRKIARYWMWHFYQELMHPQQLCDAWFLLLRSKSENSKQKSSCELHVFKDKTRKTLQNLKRMDPNWVNERVL